MNYSIIQKSQLDDAMRADAEYFGTDQILKDHYLGSQVVDFVQYGTSDDLNENTSGYPTLRLNEFEGPFIKTPEKYCNSLTESEFKKLELKREDILICRTNGNPHLVGKCAIVVKDEPFAFASYLFRVRTDIHKINPSTLLIYLHSSYGRAEVEKNMMISNQTNFSPARFKLIRIPKFDKKLQEEISIKVQTAYDLSKESRTFYLEAERLLLKELGLQDFKPVDALWVVVNYSEVKEANRLTLTIFRKNTKI